MNRILIALFFSFSLYSAEPILKVTAEYAPARNSDTFRFKIKVKYKLKENTTDNPLSIYDFSLGTEDKKYQFGSRLEYPMLHLNKEIILPGETIETFIPLDAWMKGIGKWEKDWHKIVNSDKHFIFRCTVESRFGHFQSNEVKFRLKKKER